MAVPPYPFVMKYTVQKNTNIFYNSYNYEISIERILDFHSARIWCFATYGVSEEDSNNHWAFNIIYQNYNIYLHSDKELNWFKLRWS